MNQHSFSFIMNPLLVSFRTPIEIMEGIVLRKAHDNEKTRIKNFLDSINAFHRPFVDMRVTNDSCVANTYVMDNIEENVEFGPSFISSGLVQVPPEMLEKHVIRIADLEWDYWIVEASAQIEYAALRTLCDAFLLSDLNLFVASNFEELGGEDHYTRSNRFYHDYPIRMYYRNGKIHAKDYRQTVTEHHIQQTIQIYHLLQQLDDTRYQFIRKAIIEYKNLLSLPQSSSFTDLPPPFGPIIARVVAVPHACSQIGPAVDRPTRYVA